jgi:hypothetical protein
MYLGGYNNKQCGSYFGTDRATQILHLQAKKNKRIDENTIDRLFTRDADAKTSNGVISSTEYLRTHQKFSVSPAVRYAESRIC